MRPSLKYGLSEIAALGFSDPEGSVFFSQIKNVLTLILKLKKKMILKIPIKRGYVYFFSSMEPNFLKKIYKRTKIQKLYHENKNRVLIFLLYFFLKKITAVVFHETVGNFRQKIILFWSDSDN